MTETFQIDLSDKTIFITGACGLLGRQYVNALVALGALVVASDIDEDALNALRQSSDFSEKIDTIVCDVNSEKSVVSAMIQVRKRHGHLDGLVNNAAATGEYLMRSGAPFGSFEDYSLKMWESVIKTNLTGPFLVCREASDLLSKAGGGSIVNVSSTYGLVGPDHRIYDEMPFNSMVAYAASKAGVHGLTRWLATYFGRKNIRVNTLVPGGVQNNHESKFIDRYEERTPLGRMAEPGDLSGMVTFLLSDLSSYSTGQIFVVDGGWTAI
jgi:NAD(P)-dependent dehydrogenase (short-subunit alcohol dehydrogenase family)